MKIEEMIEKLRYKANNIKAKIEPEFFNEVADALEKQVPIEHHHTKVYEVKDNIRLSICPKCLCSITTNQYEYPKYCTWCGQKIDWSDWSEADD